VRQYLPAEDPLGKSVRSPGLRLENADLVSIANPDGWLEIVGVVDDVRNDGLDRPVVPEVFIPASFVVAPSTTLLVRARGNPAVAMRAVGANLHRLNPELFILDQHEMNWLLETQAWGRESFIASLFGLFAALALALSAAGIYSVVSYTVSQRTKEFGVRMALGATRGGVLRLVLQSLLSTVALGAAAGLGLRVILAKVLATSTQATVRSPAILLPSAGVLLAVAALASLFPAWRAASIEPMKAIRTE
jgi:ABC-type antimicrobial peptide transport system permease subunit